MAATKYPDARIFEFESNFQKKARLPGGVARDKAIAHAQKEIDRQKPDFADWLSGEIASLNAAMRQADASLGDLTSIEQASFHCRQLRDVGSTVGYDLVTFVADNLCEILEAIRSGAAYDKDIIDCHLDALQLATQNQYKNLSPEQLPELSGGLRRVFQQMKKSND
jgi:hypothetical protein